MTGSTSSLPSWVNSISDSTIKTDISNAIAAGSVSFASMQTLFQDVAAQVSASGSLTTSQLQDLQTVVVNLASVGASAYVQYISSALVDGNANNVTYTGGQATASTLGNLYAGSGYTQFNELVGKWFLGSDDPSTIVSGIAGTISYVTTTLPLYSAGGPSINDINQGDLGDCYLVCGLGEVALQDPTAIENMIHDNGNGTYGVRFFINGQAEWVTVDSTLASSNGSQPFNDAYVGSAQNMWVNLIEKAYAEISTSVDVNDNISGWAGNSFSSVGDGGWPEISIAQITGATQLTLFNVGNSDNNWTVGTASAAAPYKISAAGTDTDLQVFAALEAAFNAHDDVVMASYTETSDSSNGRSELMASHAFSVIGYNATNDTIELRNPWGTETGQYWDTTFSISLSTLAGTGDYFAYDNSAPTTPAPTVEATSITLTANATNFANAAGISAIDPNGVSLASMIFTISYTGTAGVLKLNNTAEPTGSTITVTGAQLSALSYVVNGAGVDSFTISVSDGYASSAALNFTVTTPASKPTVNATSFNLTNAATVTAFATDAGISAVDPNGVSLSSLIYTISYTGSAGVLELNGVAETAGSSFLVTGADLSELSYLPSASGGVDTFTISVSDGFAASAPVTFTVTSPAVSVVAPPTINVTMPPTLSPGNSVLVSSIFSAVDNNGISASALTYALRTVLGQGNLVVDGTIEPVGSTVTLTAAQFANATYYANGAGGTDVIWLTVSDGISSSTSAAFATDLGVEVTPYSFSTTLRAQTYTASQLFSASDSAGGTITSYTIEDQDGFAGHGYFILDGVAEAVDTKFTISASQLSQLTYVSPITGTDFIYVTATAGSYSSTQAVVVVSGPATTVPSISAQSTTLTGSGSKTVLLSSLITATSTNGLPTSDYRYYIDDAGSSGYFSVGGVDDGDYVYLTQAQFAETSYVSTGKTGVDKITAYFYDGFFTSNTVSFSITTAGTPGPSIIASTTTLTSLSAVSFASLFKLSDPNGVASSNLTYTLSYSGSAGLIELNGVAEATGAPISLTAAQVAELTYNPTANGGTDTITLSASDGVANGNAVTFSVVSPPGLVITPVTTTVVVARDQVLSNLIPQLWTETDGSPNATISQYEFYDNDASGGVGNFLVGGLSGSAYAPDTILLVSAANLGTISYQGISGSQIISVRANAGTAANPHWGAWASVTVTAPAANKGAVFTPNSATIAATRDEVFSTPNASSPLSLFSATDPTGGAITQYEFYDNDMSGGLGDFQLNGNVLKNDTVQLVSAANLSALSYTAIAGTQVIDIRANDGTVAHPVWGVWASITVTAPVAAFTPNSATVTATRDKIYSTTAASNPLSLFALAGVSSDAILQYEFFDSDTGGGLGDFLLSGQVLANDVVQVVGAGSLDALTYEGIAGSQVISVRANDGTLAHPVWGAWSSITVTAPSVTVGVVFTPMNATITAQRNQIYSTTDPSNPLTLFSVADTTGGTILQYEFFVNDKAGGAGYLLTSKGALANDTVQLVSAANLEAISYKAIAGTEAVSIRANDGTAAHPVWGAWSTVTVTVQPPSSPIAAAPAIQIPTLSATGSVSALPNAIQSVVSPASLLNSAGQQPSALLALMHH
jgi:VCBS repeat-containing protein